MNFFNLFLCILFYFSSQVLIAQIPNGTIAPNFTLTDINGNTHELYDYLDPVSYTHLTLPTIYSV